MTARDSYNLLVAIWREDRGGGRDSKRGVYWVIMNRVADPRWPNNITDVILQPKQFSSFNANDPNFSKYPQPGTTSLAECAAVIDYPGPDPTGGANCYHTFPAGHPAWPSWATDDKFTLKIDSISFYKL